MKMKYFQILIVSSLFFSVQIPAVFAEQGNPSMVFFPAGEFMMGGAEGIGRKDEFPRHKVYLDSFYLDRYEVTGKDFAKFMQATKEHATITGWFGREPRPELVNSPVIGLTWKRCQKFCRWRDKRLPTEAEWERAAAGLDNRIYPWGNSAPDATKANFDKCCFIMKGLVLNPVGEMVSGRTPEKIYDMAGNIAEWVFDWYDKNYYKTSPYKNPRGPEKGKHHVIRGGAWNSLPDYLRSSSRYGYDDAKDFYGIGCRCAKSADLKLAK
jgi:formylglycine-generating enzyme required for sulfatase activity